MVMMMTHNRVTCTWSTHGAFLRPAQIWLLRRCHLHAPAVVEDVHRINGAAEKVSTGPTISAVRRE